MNNLNAELVADVEDFAIVILGDDGEVLSWNKGADRINGYAAGEIIRKNFSTLFKEDDQKAGVPITLLDTARRKGKTTYEGWRERKDGQLFWARIVITRLAESKIQFLEITQDITESKQSEERFRLVVESAPNAMVLIDPEGKIKLVNSQAEKLFGFQRNELINQGVERLIPNRHKEHHAGFRNLFFSNPETKAMGVGRELFAMRKDQSEFPVEIGLNPIETPDGSMVLAAIIDITERKKADERFRLVVELAPNAMVLVRDDGVITLINSQAEKLFGYTRSELVGKSVDLLLPARLKDKHPGFRNSFFQDPKARPMGVGRDLFARRKDGTEFPVEIGLNPIESPEGNMVLASIIDITERKLQELKLHESETKLKAIFENTEDSLTLIDAELNVVAFNKSNARYPAQFAGSNLEVGKNILSALPEGRRKQFEILINHVREGEVVKTLSRQGTGSSERWFHVSINPVKDDDGKIIGYCITSHDATEIKKAEGEIRRLNKSLLNFQNAIHRSSIVSITDPNGRITFVNENFVKTSGYALEELLGNTHRLVNSGFHPPSFWKNMWETITDGRTWRERVKNRAKDGRYYWIDTFITPFFDNEGRVTEYLSIRNDITDRVKAEEEVLQQRLLLEEAAKLSKIGYWVHDGRGDSLHVSKEMLSLLELPQEDFDRDQNSIYEKIVSEDRERVQTERSFFNAFKDKFETEYRIKKRDGSIRWIYQKSESKKLINDEEVVIGTVQDITERKIIEQVLRDYNERFEILSKATNDAIWDLDVRLDVVVWNYALIENFGYEEGNIEYTFTWWQQRIHPDDREKILSSLGNAMNRHDNTWNETYRFECADGSFKDVNNRAYILYDGSKPIRIIGSMQDISERIRYTREIEKLSLVASATSNGVTITDKNGLIEWVNESFTKLTGYKLDEIKGRNLSFLQGPETDKNTVKRISKKLKEQQLVSEEIINYNKSGNKFWLKLDIAPVFNETGELVNFISIQTDITTIKEFEDSITSIARELSNLIENANVPIFGVDKSGHINEWNRVSEQLTEFSKDQVVGRKLNSLLAVPDSVLNFDQVIRNALHNIPGSEIELPLITRTGKQLILLLSASPRRSIQNETTGVIFVAQNVTELINYRTNLERMVEERTRELHAALEKEKELVKMKTQFVSIASHEFRTPLATISLAAGFIKKYKSKLSPEGIDEKIETIQRQLNHMTYLLDDILMVGKAEAGKIPVNLAPIRISDFIQNLSFEVTRSTGNTHKIVVTEDLKYREIMSDEKLMRNIIINLLNNAIKFSPNARHVDVHYITEGDHLLLTVKDYGIGIPEEDLEKLFQPFSRAGNVESIQGTGLGLSIIKKAVDLLGGKLAIDSKLGEGTTITVELPI
jgi:PAS domain S-box-containing protein